MYVAVSTRSEGSGILLLGANLLLLFLSYLCRRPRFAHPLLSDTTQVRHLWFTCCVIYGVSPRASVAAIIKFCVHQPFSRPGLFSFRSIPFCVCNDVPFFYLNVSTQGANPFRC
ncbi:MAG: hypothetical protein Ct9H300mP8_08200 [Gammaproteobacteria bacterium]|nr:MAG: hypothetical protein Ct9H300mP8_08200 [Gammaproteobacteria bacterium]